MATPYLLESPGARYRGEFDVKRGTKHARRLLRNVTNDAKNSGFVFKEGKDADKIIAKCITMTTAAIGSRALNPRVIAQDLTNPKHFRNYNWHIDSIAQGLQPVKPIEIVIGSTEWQPVVIEGEVDASPVFELFCAQTNKKPKQLREDGIYVPGALFFGYSQTAELVNECVEASIASGRAREVPLEPGQLVLLLPGTIHRARRPDEIPPNPQPRLTIEFV